MAFWIKNSIRPRRNIKTPASSDDDSETFSSDVAEGDFESDFDNFLIHDEFLVSTALPLLSKDSFKDGDFKIFIDSLRANLKKVKKILEFILYKMIIKKSNLDSLYH